MAMLPMHMIPEQKTMAREARSQAGGPYVRGSHPRFMNCGKPPPQLLRSRSAAEHTFVRVRRM